MPRPPRVPRIPRTPPTPLPVLRPVQWPAATPLGLEDATSLAIERSPSIAAQVAEVEARIARIYQTISGYRPHVELRYSATRFEQPLGAPFTTSIIGNNVVIQAAPFTLSQFEDRLQLTQLLSDGGHLRLIMVSDIAAARAAMADLIYAVYQLQYEVRTAYIAVLEAQAQVGVAQESLRTAQEHLRMARAQYEAGSVARADITFSTTPVTRAKIALQNAENAVDTTMAHFLATIGSDPGKPVALAGVDLPNAETSLRALRDTAQRDRADLHARQQDTAATAALVDAAKRSRSINVQATTGYREIGYQTKQVVPQYSGWTLGVEFSYPLVDGGLITAQIQEARAHLAGASARQEALARQIDEDVVRAWYDLANARERLELAQAEVAQAEESLGVAQGQYQAGVGTNLQVLDAQVVRNRAMADAVNARYGVERAIARMLLVSGR